MYLCVKNMLQNHKSAQNQQHPSKQMDSRRPPKTIKTSIYAEQLAPLYPSLTKTQVKAALILANNNMHECRLVLDMKCRFVELKRSFNTQSGRAAKSVADSSDSGSSTAARTKCIKSEKMQKEVGNWEMVNSLGASRGAANLQRATVTSSSSTEWSSTIRSSTSSVSVYDFSENESCIEPPKEWLDKRRHEEHDSTNKKVGVIITKSQTGYKAYPL